MLLRKLSSYAGMMMMMMIIIIIIIIISSSSTFFTSQQFSWFSEESRFTDQALFIHCSAKNFVTIGHVVIITVLCIIIYIYIYIQQGDSAVLNVGVICLE